MSQPLIGIALAAYNPNIDYFREQLGSIVNQSYGHWFCVITLDSPLDPLRCEDSLAPYFADRRFSWLENEVRLGSKRNFTHGARLCVERGAKYIAFSDQDDIWDRSKLEHSLAVLEAYPPMSLVHCNMWILMRKDTPRGTTFTTLDQTAWQLERRGVHNVRPLDLLVRNIAAGAGTLMDAELVRRFPEAPDSYNDHDYWYAMVASYHGGVHALHEPLYQYRIHGGNILGLQAYRDFFASSNTSKKRGFFQQLAHVVKDARGHALEARFAKLPVSNMEHIIAASRGDFGIGFLLVGLRRLRNDRALARACFARAAGKFLSAFGLLPKTQN